MELSVTIADNWKLLTSVSSSLNPTWLNYDFQRNEMKTVAKMLIPWRYMWMVRHPFSFLFQTRNQDQDFIEIRILMKLS